MEVPSEQKYPADIIETVAKAIYRAKPMVPPWEVLAEASRKEYRKMAVAALDALGLTANWGTQIRDDAGEVVDRDDYGEDESEARRQSDRYDEPLIGRWCTPWVEVTPDA